MSKPTLYIFDPQAPETTNFEVQFSSETNGLGINGAKIDIGNGEVLTIFCRVTSENLAYSFALKSNDEHRFTVMGFMQSKDTSDPTIMYTATDGRDFQISVNI